MAAKKYEVKWTINAHEDYERILYYLLSEWSLNVVENFMLASETRIYDLSFQPFIGKVSARDKNVRSILLSKHNRLYYRIQNNIIELLDIFDTRQAPERNKFE